MPTPFESAQLNLQLFALRREPVLREARAWFLHDFNPTSLPELATLAGGERNKDFRTVLSYWEMAASLVTTGAIEPQAFLAAHSEVVATYCKIQPFVAELRTAISEPEFCVHLERVVMCLPDAEAVMDRRRTKLRSAAEARAEAAAMKGEQEPTQTEPPA